MKTQIMHILGNLKGGVINAEQAFEGINSVYHIEIQKLRYPSEPPLYLGDKSDIVPIMTFEKD